MLKQHKPGYPGAHPLQLHALQQSLATAGWALPGALRAAGLPQAVLARWHLSLSTQAKPSCRILHDPAVPPRPNTCRL